MDVSLVTGDPRPSTPKPDGFLKGSKMFNDILKFLCTAQTDAVFSALTDLGFVNNGRYAFKPGISATSPLVVCHADTVVDGGFGPHNFKIKGDKVISIALDDRLGIACMVDAVTSKSPLGACAMLVCDDEEIGQSTARIFSEDIKPNWMVELDRRGDDVVAYEYDTPLLRSLLCSAGWVVGQGSFSDICYLGKLGVIGFNMGVGYHSEHSLGCHANLGDTRRQIAKLHTFLARFGDTRLDYEPKVYRSRTVATSSFEYDEWSIPGIGR